MLKARDYLNQIRKLDTLIRNKQYEVMQWKALATGTTVPTTGERVQTSGCKQKMADAVHRYIEIEAEIMAEIAKCVEVKREIIRTIEQLPATEYDLLHKVYIQKKTLYEAIDGTDRTYSWVTTVHGRALKHLQDILDQK